MDVQVAEVTFENNSAVKAALSRNNALIVDRIVNIVPHVTTAGQSPPITSSPPPTKAQQTKR